LGYAMKRGLQVLFICCGLLTAMFVRVGQSEAALGGPADSVEADSKVLAAVRHSVAAHKGYTIQEISSEVVTVREYVSSSGIVFGIAWNGLIHPDLTQLLGLYAGQYQEALKRAQRTPGQRRLKVKTSGGVVVEKWGHMRNLQGRAYLSALMPAGVSVNEIR